MKSNTQRIQPKLPTLSPPPKQQHSPTRPRSRTNFHPSTNTNTNTYTEMQVQTQGDQKISNKNGENQVKNRMRTYSQSHATLKPSIHTGSTKEAKLLKMDSNKYSTLNLNPKDKSSNRTKGSKSLLNKKIPVSNPSKSSQLRSKILSTYIHPQNDPKPQKPHTNPYDKFIKQLNIHLPTPQQKFHQFLQIPPFNRLKNHTDFISHILHKNSPFFHMHPPEIIDNIAKKIILLTPEDIPHNYLAVLDDGECFYAGKKIGKGCLLTRNRYEKELASYDGGANVIGLPHHQYSAFVSQYLNAHMERFRKFMEGIQIFKIFTEHAMQKIYASLTLHFYSQGQTLYQPGQPADTLYLIYSGSAARKIIVQIDKTNKIPIQKYSKLVKVLSRSYQHKIKFGNEDLVGVADIVDNIQKRSQDILVDEDTTVLTIDRTAIQQNLDEYIIDRLRKYNLKKYPKNYDELCQNYLKQKMQNRKAQERKISALKDAISRDSHNERKNQKIGNIIRIYQERIRVQEKEHLVERKKIERIVQSDS